MIVLATVAHATALAAIHAVGFPPREAWGEDAIGLQLALLHEAHDPIIGKPLLCPYCGHVVPDMAFCPACGVATRASSRSSRALRRSERPQRVDPEPEQQ